MTIAVDWEIKQQTNEQSITNMSLGWPLDKTVIKSKHSNFLSNHLQKLILVLFVLFDMILMSQSAFFQLCWDGLPGLNKY